MRKEGLFLVIMGLFALLLSCNSGSNKPSINQGTVRLAIDEAFEPVISEIIASYKVHYPKTNFVPLILPENKAIKYLFDDSVTLAVTGRGFNEEELKVLTANGVSYLPAIMGIDAAVLVVNKSFPDSVISQSALKNILTTPNSKYKVIVDKPLSTNYNTVVDKLKLNISEVKNIFSVDSNLAIIKSVINDPSTIGILSYNLISDMDDPQALELKNTVKILGLSDSTDSKFYKPSSSNLKNYLYPFARNIYLHTKTKSWGVENGIIRFACSKKGQLIVEKIGLIPYFNIPKEFFINKKNENNTFFNF